MAQITDLQYQKKDDNRVNIYVDDCFYAGASLESVMKFGIKKGNEVSEEFLKEFLIADQTHKATTMAINLASRYAKTEKQLVDYLKSKSFCEEVIILVVEKLKEYGFINDRAYIENYVGFKKHVSGKNKIKQELIKKGIEKALVEEVLEELFFEENEEVCRVIAEKYIKNKEKTKENMIKLNRHLISKGFDYADINKVIREIIKGEEDENWD